MSAIIPELIKMAIMGFRKGGGGGGAGAAQRDPNEYLFGIMEKNASKRILAGMKAQQDQLNAYDEELAKIRQLATPDASPE